MRAFAPWDGKGSGGRSVKVNCGRGELGLKGLGGRNEYDKWLVFWFEVSWSLEYGVWSPWSRGSGVESMELDTSEVLKFGKIGLIFLLGNIFK